MPGKLPDRSPTMCTSMRNRDDSNPPAFEDLVTDLKLVRLKGIGALRQLTLPALVSAAVSSGHADDEAAVDAPVIETLLREAMVDLEGSRYGEAGSILFGISPGARGEPPHKLREEAARAFDVSTSHFRNHYERILINQLAEITLRRCYEHQLRLSVLDMERKIPTSSRLAVAWMDRFESYYSMWTPAYAVAASITAYRSTLLEEDRPWDRKPTPEEPEGYTQERQAQGYGSEALFWLTEYLVELRRFRTRFGGLWLLSSKQADSDIADAAYLIHYRAPFGERDESFLRKVFDGILDRFRMFETDDPYFADLHAMWQRFLATCQCEWSASEPPERGHFHTHRTVPSIDETCQPHLLIAAANDYCTLIDYEWDLIADWYHIGEPRRVGVDGAQLYEEFRESARQRGINLWPPWGSVARSDET